MKIILEGEEFELNVGEAKKWGVLKKIPPPRPTILPVTDIKPGDVFFWKSDNQNQCQVIIQGWSSNGTSDCYNSAGCFDNPFLLFSSSWRSKAEMLEHLKNFIFIGNYKDLKESPKKAIETFKKENPDYKEGFLGKVETETDI